MKTKLLKKEIYKKGDFVVMKDDIDTEYTKGDLRNGIRTNFPYEVFVVDEENDPADSIHYKTICGWWYSSSIQGCATKELNPEYR